MGPLRQHLLAARLHVRSWCQTRRRRADGTHTPRQLQSLGGLTGLIDQTRKRFGDITGFRLVIYPDYAVIDRPDPNRDRRQLSYTYRGGWGDPTASAKTSDADAVDLSRFDPKATVGILRGARRPSASNSRTSKPRTW
ncbi:hypothetical protein I553_8611 [Mycobacterium xenopi 4042]|uniref:Uncharacterized protein n=1 Tax=Mycobacterium xenopi 4042 TaxID=1299334 RepID=X8CM78_MYCXE|nr:hypothetical protein I553_8611 [Mycobacterium xenopi 4042]